MIVFTVNGQAQTGQFGLKNWANLLDHLERGAGLGRSVVTAVRFAGVDEPTFRAPDILSRSLESAGPIDIDLSTAGDLLHESARAAVDSILPLAAAVRSIAVEFRAGDSRQASALLAELAVAFDALVRITDHLTTEVGTPATRQDIDGLAAQLGTALHQIIDHQKRAEWPAVADGLTTLVPPALAAWVPLLEALDRDACRQTVSAPMTTAPLSYPAVEAHLS